MRFADTTPTSLAQCPTFEDEDDDEYEDEDETQCKNSDTW